MVSPEGGAIRFYTAGGPNVSMTGDKKRTNLGEGQLLSLAQISNTASLKNLRYAQLNSNTIRAAGLAPLFISEWVVPSGIHRVSPAFMFQSANPFPGTVSRMFESVNAITREPYASVRSSSRPPDAIAREYTRMVGPVKSSPIPPSCMRIAIGVAKPSPVDFMGWTKNISAGSLDLFRSATLNPPFEVRSSPCSSWYDRSVSGDFV